MVTRESIVKKLRAFWKNRVKPFWAEYEVPFFLLVGAITFILGYVGYDKHLGASRPPLDILYLTVQMFRMIYLQAGPLPWELEMARWMALFLMFYAGLRLITVLFYEQTQLLGLKWLTRDHVIICGLNQKTSILCEGFFESGRKAVIIDKDPAKDQAEKCKEYGAIVFTGEGADRHVLERARIKKAACLVAISDDDGQNASVALMAREAAFDRKGFKPLLCLVQIADRRLCNMLKADYELEKAGPGPFRLEFFNAYDQAAGALLKAYPPAYEGRTAIVGPGKLGESLLLRMATTWLVSRGSAKARLNITLVDPEAGRKKDGLLLRYPILAATCDVHAIDMDLKILELDRIFRDGPVSKLYVCTDADSETLAITLTLRRAAERHASTVIACMERRSGLSKLAGGPEAFEGFDTAYRPEVLLGGTRETLARAIHEEYVREQERQGVAPGDNPSMAAWDRLSEGLKESNRHNADHILVKLAAVDCGIELLTDAAAIDFTFAPDEVERMAFIEHGRWVDERRKQGWAYAPGAKDIEKKASPYIVPWETLTEEIKEYDRNVVRGLPRFLAGAGFQVYREKPGKAIAGEPKVII